MYKIAPSTIFIAARQQRLSYRRSTYIFIDEVLPQPSRHYVRVVRSRDATGTTTLVAFCFSLPLPIEQSVFFFLVSLQDTPIGLCCPFLCLIARGCPVSLLGEYLQRYSPTVFTWSLREA